MSKAISVVVVGRSLDQQERVRLRSLSHTPLAILGEFPATPEVFNELNRLRPQAVLVFLNGELNRSFQLVERIHQELPETSVICSSADNSPDVILQSFRSGAVEYIRQPMVEEEISAVFAKIELANSRPEGSNSGRVIAVYASKGGCGTTFVTTNLAASLARLMHKRAFIMDLNFQAGDQPLYLGIEPIYSIHDLVRNFDRLDEKLLSSYLTPRSKSLALLAAPTEVSKGEDIKVEHVAQAIALLRMQADYVVIDPPRALNEITISALDVADDLLLLLTLDIPAIRSAKRTFDIFTQLGYDRSRIKVIINRYTKIPEIDIKQVERVLETKVFATIANDYQAAIASINIGEPLVLSKSQSRIVQDFGELADKLAGVRQQNEPRVRTRPQRKSGWASIFGGRR